MEVIKRNINKMKKLIAIKVTMEGGIYYYKTYPYSLNINPLNNT
jgi:hypothetical protein